MDSGSVNGGTFRVLGRGPLEMRTDLGALAAFFGGFLILIVRTFRYERTR